MPQRPARALLTSKINSSPMRPRILSACTGVSSQQLGKPAVSLLAAGFFPQVSGGGEDPYVTQLLMEELRLRQRRLGTSAEQPDDYERVCQLAHDLSNRITAVQLLEELAANDIPIPPELMAHPDLAG